MCELCLVLAGKGGCENGGGEETETGREKLTSRKYRKRGEERGKEMSLDSPTECLKHGFQLHGH